ncbi:MAG: TRAP transporter large permease [Gammaproteobacteria bacterium]
MAETVSIIVFIGALFILLAGGVWVGASLLMTAALGMFLFTARPVGDAMALTIWGAQSSWSLTALPLFIWMGEILFHSKLSENLFLGIAPFMRRLPGGALHVNIGASAVFASISGSSAATVATVGKMSIPELRKRGYPEKMIIGTLSGAGTLGLLIPPSISMIIYGITVNESITQLFIASLIPGVVLVFLFMGYIAVWGMLNKSAYKRDPGGQSKLRSLALLAPAFAVIAGVIGSIYSGVATATEAAALGVAGSFILSYCQGSLNRRSFEKALFGAAKVSAMIMFILMGAEFLSLAMGFTGIPRRLAEGIGALELSPLALIAMLTVFYIVLGCFLDGISSIVLTMAVIEPMVRQAGFDMLWFGVYLMAVVEMAQITPPVGFNLFVLQQMTGKGIPFIARASMPMFFVIGGFIVILVLFPQLATWLPKVAGN